MNELLKAASRRAKERATIAANMPMIGMMLAGPICDMIRHPKEGIETLKRISKI